METEKEVYSFNRAITIVLIVAVVLDVALVLGLARFLMFLRSL